MLPRLPLLAMKRVVRRWSCRSSSSRRTFELLVLLVFFLAEVMVKHTGSAIKLLPIFWNTGNPIFRVDNTDHVRDVSISDTIDIVCPRYPEGTPENLIEYHSVFQVTKEEYESCRLTFDSPVTRHILSCHQPFDNNVYRLAFREFTPLPMGLEFQPGKDYYYISVSNGTQNGLMNNRGGACKRSHLKIIFKVCCHENDSIPWRRGFRPRRPHTRRNHQQQHLAPPPAPPPNPTAAIDKKSSSSSLASMSGGDPLASAVVIIEEDSGGGGPNEVDVEVVPPRIIIEEDVILPKSDRFVFSHSSTLRPSAILLMGAAILLSALAAILDPC